MATISNESAVNHINIGGNDDMSTDDDDDDDDDGNLDFSFHSKDKQQTQTHCCSLTISQQWMLFIEALLKNSHDSESSLDIHCNSGFATIPKISNFPLSSYLVSPRGY